MLREWKDQNWIYEFIKFYSTQSLTKQNDGKWLMELTPTCLGHKVLICFGLVIYFFLLDQKHWYCHHKFSKAKVDSKFGTT